MLKNLMCLDRQSQVLLALPRKMSSGSLAEAVIDVIAPTGQKMTCKEIRKGLMSLLDKRPECARIIRDAFDGHKQNNSLKVPLERLKTWSNPLPDDVQTVMPWKMLSTKLSALIHAEGESSSVQQRDGVRDLPGSEKENVDANESIPIATSGVCANPSIEAVVRSETGFSGTQLKIRVRFVKIALEKLVRAELEKNDTDQSLELYLEDSSCCPEALMPLFKKSLELSSEIADDVSRLQKSGSAMKRSIDQYYDEYNSRAEKFLRYTCDFQR